MPNTSCHPLWHDNVAMLVVNKIQHFFSLEPGSGVGKKGETKSLGTGKGSPSNLASLALSSLQPLIVFLCCCFTSSLKPMKKGKNIQCQCIKLCLNNMLISLDNCRFAIWVQLSEASSKNGYGFYRPIRKNMGWKKVCFDLKQGQDFFPIWPWEGCPGHFHIKVMGMLVVSLWGVDYRFWSHLGCLGWKVTIFAHSGITKKFTKNALTLTTQKSPLEVNLSLSHTHIGLP